jgi:hypothetical protein
VGWGIDWIDLAEKNDRWRAHVNAVLNLSFHKMQKIFCQAENLLVFQE